MSKKVDVLQVLADVLNAMFSGEKVVVETTGVRFANTYKVFRCDPQILTPEGAQKNSNSRSDNVLAAKTIKVGRDIVIKRHGKNFIVRTPSGEVILENTLNSDIGYIWAALGLVYDNGEKDIMRIAGNLARQLPTKELRDMAKNVALHGMVLKPKKNKYETAIEQLKEMGIQPKRLVAYIEKKQKEND